MTAGAGDATFESVGRIRDRVYAAPRAEGRRAAPGADSFPGARPQRLGWRREQAERAKPSFSRTTAADTDGQIAGQPLSRPSFSRAISRNCSIMSAGRAPRSAAARWADASRWPWRACSRHESAASASSTRPPGTASRAPRSGARVRRTRARRVCPALVDFQVERWFGDGFRRDHPALVARAADVFVANDLDCYAASCALLGDADLRAYLHAVRVPVSIMVGEEDYATPIEMARLLHQAIPHSTLTILPGARHLTPVECPDQISAQLRTVLQRE